MFIKFAGGLSALILSGTLFAADTVGSVAQKVSFIPSANASIPPPGQTQTHLSDVANEPLVFSAPPHESWEEAARIYQPVADYFSRTLGRKVEYRHPKSWLTYQTEMAKGNYDIVFDGPHFNSWRISRLNYSMLAKIADESVFVVVTRKDNTQIKELKQLAGKKMCGINPSNLATLSVTAEFEPMRQPLVMDSVGWTKVYEGVMEGRCTAGTLPVAVLRKLDRAGNATRIVHQSRQLPSQAFSAGPRVTVDEQAKLARALTSAMAKQPLEPLLTANDAEKGLALAFKEEYVGLDSYLKNVWGYSK